MFKKILLFIIFSSILGLNVSVYSATYDTSKDYSDSCISINCASDDDKAKKQKYEKKVADDKAAAQNISENNTEINKYDKIISEQDAILSKEPSNSEAQKKLYQAVENKSEKLRENAHLNSDVRAYKEASFKESSAKSEKIKASHALSKTCNSNPCSEEDKATKEYKEAKETYDEKKKLAEEAEAKAKELKDVADKSVEEANKEIDKNNDIAKAAKEAYDDSDLAEGDITSRGYEISVNDISPGMNVTGKSTEENVNYALATIIQTLMIALGSFALLIMTIGAGYIVLHHGQDELLSKGKSIFMSGVYALVVALSSYYLINIIRFILYQGS